MFNSCLLTLIHEMPLQKVKNLLDDWGNRVSEVVMGFRLVSKMVWLDYGKSHEDKYDVVILKFGEYGEYSICSFAVSHKMSKLICNPGNLAIKRLFARVVVEAAKKKLKEAYECMP